MAMICSAISRLSIASCLLLMSGCQQAAMDMTPIPRLIPTKPSAPTVPAKATPTPTSVPTLTSTPSPVPTLPPAPELTDTPVNGMPEYYRPHPSIVRVGENNWLFPNAHWINNNRFQLATLDYTDDGFTCNGEVWNIDSNTGQPVLVQANVSNLKACNWPRHANADTDWFSGLFGEFNQPGINVAPDGRRALAFAWIEVDGETPPGTASGGILLSDEIMDYTYYEQGWLLDLETRQASPLYTSREFFGFYWADDSRHLVGIGSCYGMVGYGMFILDTETDQVRILDNSAMLCEGDPGIDIAPGSGHLIYAGIVYSMAGEQLVDLCPDGFAHSAAWSQDGRYAYAACSGDGSDTLRRYDTQTGQVVSLTDPAAQTFRAINLFPSPDQYHMLIVWGDSILSPTRYGVWLLDILKP